jgi:N-acylneuraminate cytidylyltransferase
MRPGELAQDDSPEWLTWQHAVRMVWAGESDVKTDVFVCVSPTSPLRAVDDVNNCIRLLLNSDADMVITVKPAERNPYFNMVVLDGAGYARLVIPPERPIHRRQDAPPVYDITTVAYAFRPEFVLRANSELEGRVKAVVVPAERALDIDTELDFKFAEFLLSQSRSSQR